MCRSQDLNSCQRISAESAEKSSGQTDTMKHVLLCGVNMHGQQASRQTIKVHETVCFKVKASQYMSLIQVKCKPAFVKTHFNIIALMGF